MKALTLEQQKENMDLHGIVLHAPCNQIWRHRSSGNLYVLLFVATLEATLEFVAVYERVDIARLHGIGATVWVRPMAEWFERFESCNRTASEVEQ